MAQTTCLNFWHDVVNEGDTHTTYTRDTWEIPEGGAEIWCTGWRCGRSTIKPYGDGCHVFVGPFVYHCDEFMEILKKHEAQGYTWGIDGVQMTREQRIHGFWKKVKLPKKEAV